MDGRNGSPTTPGDPRLKNTAVGDPLTLENGFLGDVLGYSGMEKVKKIYCMGITLSAIFWIPSIRNVFMDAFDILSE